MNPQKMVGNSFKFHVGFRGEEGYRGGQVTRLWSKKLRATGPEKEKKRKLYYKVSDKISEIQTLAFRLAEVCRHPPDLRHGWSQIYSITRKFCG